MSEKLVLFEMDLTIGTLLNAMEEISQNYKMNWVISYKKNITKHLKEY